jgi:polyhydroxyalkanoate synthesis regulator phasin
MDEPGRTGNEGPYGERDPLDRLGALLGPRVDELRALLEELTGRWRGDAMRVGEGSRQRLRDLFRELGLITRDDWDELELRVSQLEHRLRLVEDKQDA